MHCDLRQKFDYRVVFAVWAAGMLAACTTAPSARPPGMAETAMEMFPDCREEIQGYVDLARLAATYGRDWDVFQDALGDMKAQVLDCADEKIPENAVQTIGNSRPRGSAANTHARANKQGERLPPPSLLRLFSTAM
ncbi:MAG TPA: hypothetical protein VGD08_12335 [Stellaceae bacterium]|jgi:hypothetical protein